MKERGILFSAPMALAVIEGRKTQTRRACKLNASGWVSRGGKHWHPDDPNAVLACPYGIVGDRLWGRETCAIVGSVDPGWVIYRASGYESECRRHAFDSPPPESEIKWRPSIHMPRWAARILLEVVRVRIERLHDISDADCIAEGIVGGKYGDGRLPYGYGLPGWTSGYLPKIAYAKVWNDINGPGSFHQNPRVWAITFKRFPA